MKQRVFLIVLALLLAPLSARAEEAPKPDDSVAFDLAAEDWVATKTAHVLVGVEAAVNAANASSVRSDMTKAVNDAAKADWRLTTFSRSQDQTGMERWSVIFDARLPESALNGLQDALKKASKAGLQLSVASIDFLPTLDETESARAALRLKLVKGANEQLAALNSTLPGRNYRISQISFESNVQSPLPRQPRGKMLMAAMAVNSDGADAGSGQDHAQKMGVTAHVVFAAQATGATNQH